jgi:hypothetical protein
MQNQNLQGRQLIGSDDSENDLDYEPEEPTERGELLPINWE